MHRLARWLLVVALSLSIGLQWAVVQGAAWVGMFVSFSKEATFSQSLSRTFDGRHPCGWCKAAQRGESTQGKQNAEHPPLKLVLAATEAEPFDFSPAGPGPEPEHACSVVQRSHAPPLPPPRAA
jgi:hypothetical protein